MNLKIGGQSILALEIYLDKLYEIYFGGKDLFLYNF
jgi:hypothetical protein